MKRILITGANSYIGTSFEKYIEENYSNDFTVDTVDMIDGTWRQKSFSSYDVIYHVAGIAHSDSGRISPEKEKLYRSVNTDLTIETAKKAKKDGVKQFIFMSSAIVYGDSAPIGRKKVITKDTPVSPANCYGDSKVQAEKGIIPLSDDSFKVVILRPPMIYGKGSKGNFPQLEKLAKRIAIFPYVKNERSMLYIGNLVEFVRLMIENNEYGIFWPCNRELCNTSELVKLIARYNGKRVFLLSGFGWVLKLLSYQVKKINKAFGNFVYSEQLGDYKTEYRRYSLDQSIREIE